ncbi:MAG: chalcone isomerase family protein [Sulfuritalea sp.]|nr:chalcone isomerase family protein [Sulfuritalea sp.]
MMAPDHPPQGNSFMKQFVANLLPARSLPAFAALEVAGVRFDDTAKGAAGEDFDRALLKIWPGDKPVQDDLKEHLLGKAAQ